MIYHTLYTTYPPILIKENVTKFFEQKTFNRDGSLYLACNEKRTFSHLNNIKNIICGNYVSPDRVAIHFVFACVFVKV